jgi:TfoX/Sxy family transcriptional regulator of competence genes
MQIPKPTESDRARFEALVPADPRVAVKPMFGNLGAFVNGNMFMGLFGADIGVKLARADADELLATEGAGPFGPAERPMGGYVTLPAIADRPVLDAWIARSLAYVASLPPKAAKK